MAKRNKITVIVGKKGSGKSFLANRLTLTEPRLLIIDPTNDYGGGTVFKDNKRAAEALLAVSDGEPFRYIFKHYRSDDTEELFYILEELSLNHQIFTNYVLLIDEAHEFAGSRGYNTNLRNLITRGRHGSVSSILISQRPYLLSREATSQADEIISFRMTEARDLDFLEKEGFDPSALRQLGHYEHIRLEK